jgi:hypothetical protein
VTRRHSRRQDELWLRTHLSKVLTPRPRSVLPVIAWRWRYELLLLIAATAVLTGLAWRLGTEWTVIGTSTMAGAFGPPWPESVIARFWCLVTPHRLRAAFVHAHIHTTGGRLPMIVRTTPAPFGERVLVWCPAGVTPEDLEMAQTALRAACWACDVRFVRDPGRSHLVTVNVIRRRRGLPGRTGPPDQPPPAGTDPGS